MTVRLADEAFAGMREATIDLINAMTSFRERRDQVIKNIMNSPTRDLRMITKQDAYYQAMQSPGVKEAAQDCQWAATRIQAFGTAYQSSLMREDEGLDVG